MLLDQVGYQTENGGNAPNFNYFRTRVLYDPEVAKSQAAAQEVAELFGDAEVREAPAGPAALDDAARDRRQDVPGDARAGARPTTRRSGSVPRSSPTGRSRPRSAATETARTSR